MNRPRSSLPRWWPWHLNPDTMTLQLPYPGDPDSITYHVMHEVALSECRRSAEVLDWVAQVAGKRWEPYHDTAAVVAGLVFAFDDVLHLQATLCGSGVDHELSEAAIARLVHAFLRKFDEETGS